MKQLVSALYADLETGQYWTASTDPDNPEVQEMEITPEQFRILIDAERDAIRRIMARLAPPEFYGKSIVDLLKELE